MVTILKGLEEREDTIQQGLGPESWPSISRGGRSVWGDISFFGGVTFLSEALKDKEIWERLLRWTKGLK